MVDLLVDVCLAAGVLVVAGALALVALVSVLAPILEPARPAVAPAKSERERQ